MNFSDGKFEFSKLSTLLFRVSASIMFTHSTGRHLIKNVSMSAKLLPNFFPEQF